MFCSRCRTWQRTEAMLNSFASVCGQAMKVLAWVCPNCAPLRAEKEPKNIKRYKVMKSDSSDALHARPAIPLQGTPQPSNQKAMITGSSREGISVQAGIYMIRRADSAVKVGSTTKLEYRLSQIEREHGKVDLLHWVPSKTARWSEIEIHKALAPHRVRGEWYTLDDDRVRGFPQFVLGVLRGAPSLAKRRRTGGRPRLPEAEKRARATDRTRQWRRGRQTGG